MLARRPPIPWLQCWFLTASLVSFTLSFFLTQSYGLWREVYSVTRRLQGRLNDIGLLIATAAKRDDLGSYTPESERLLERVARYVRLFNVLFYASVTTRFAPLCTPAGLNQLVESGALTEDERLALLDGNSHNTVLEWICIIINNAIREGRLGDGTPASQTALYQTMAAKTTELRSTYATIPDLLTGRMPLAYAQLVQILTDLLVLFSPFALIHKVGGVGAVVGTALVTLFHTSILNLAKLLLDPFNNENYGGSSRISINVETLLHETNLGSNRWRRGARWVPREARKVHADPLEVVGPIASAPSAAGGDGGRGSSAADRSKPRVAATENTARQSAARPADVRAGPPEEDMAVASPNEPLGGRSAARVPQTSSPAGAPFRPSTGSAGKAATRMRAPEFRFNA